MNAVIEAPKPILVDTNQAANLLSISPRTLWKLTKEGVIPSVRIGGSVRYSIAAINKWVNDQNSIANKKADDAQN